MFANLLIVVAVGLLAPSRLASFPGPAAGIVLELVLGVVIGPRAWLGKADGRSRSWPCSGSRSCSFSLAWKSTLNASADGS